MKLDELEQAARCWTEEWKRTNPDIIVYLPTEPQGKDADNEHFLVFEAPYDGHLLAVWTRAEAEGGHNQHIAFARSTDDGATWQEPTIIAGPDGDDDKIASWGFPVVSKTGRIYCFYTKFTGVVDTHRQMTGWLQCVYSDDNGHVWRDGGIVPLRRSSFDHPDPAIPPNFIVWQKPIRDAQGRQIVGLTRHKSKAVRGKPKAGGWLAQDTQCEFIRFDNIDEGPDPQQLVLTCLPADGIGLRVPMPGVKGYSMAQEPSLTLLPDGRLFCVMRTLTGRIWFSVSDDDGATWTQPDVLRYKDGGEEVLQPVAPCPVYALKDGRYLLLFHNNDGTSGGGAWPGDSNKNRDRAFLAVGEYREEAYQPIWFSRPKLFGDSAGIALGPSQNGLQKLEKPFRVEVATYTSLTEKDGKRILWYPDRKHFLLGRYITDEWLEGMTAPTDRSLYYPLVKKTEASPK